MAAAEQAQAARAAAVAEVQRLLATADDLKRLGALREDVAARLAVRMLWEHERQRPAASRAVLVAMPGR